MALRVVEQRAKHLCAHLLGPDALVRPGGQHEDWFARVALTDGSACSGLVGLHAAERPANEAFGSVHRVQHMARRLHNRISPDDNASIITVRHHRRGRELTTGVGHNLGSTVGQDGDRGIGRAEVDADRAATQRRCLLIRCERRADQDTHHVRGRRGPVSRGDHFPCLLIAPAIKQKFNNYSFCPEVSSKQASKPGYSSLPLRPLFPNRLFTGVPYSVTLV